MMIFSTRIVLFFVFFSPAHLDEYTRKIIQADFNSGEDVYKGHLPLTLYGEKMCKITPTVGEKTFSPLSIRTMIGSYVEFETRNEDPKVRCNFEDAEAARDFFFELTEDAPAKIKFPLVSVTQVNVRGGQATSSIRTHDIAGGYLGIGSKNRLMVVSGRSLPEMILSAKQFNVSQRPSGDSVSVAVRVRDIQFANNIILQLSVKFINRETAKRFHEYVKGKSCTDARIPVADVSV